jgi:uncharacterized protein YjbI with pentapeptide repeats
MTNFSGADLRGARLDNADMREASFRESDLTGARFRGIELAGFAEAGQVLGRLWNQAVARARRLPPEALREPVDGRAPPGRA